MTSTFPILLGVLLFAPIPPARSAEVLLFEEPFEDTRWESRGWYDGPTMRITGEEHIPGSENACVWHWKNAGDLTPEGKGARMRFSPVDNVTLSFYIKHSANWEWTGVNWHPHEFHFVTTEDPEFVGPAYTHLTFYIEIVNGVPRLAIQDGKNIDNDRIGQDLVDITENRAVAGGNGDSDGHGGGYYRNGDVHWNGKHWEPRPAIKYFGDGPDPHNKTEWHHVRAHLKLNSIQNGIGIQDGILQYWFDGDLIIEHHDVVFRTGQHPNMKINQFLMLPYFGPGVPHEQKIWIDDLKIHTSTPDDPSGGKSNIDFNNDGEIGFIDFILFATQFGKTRAQPGFDTRFDLNANDAIDFADFITFVAAFDQRSSPTS